MCEVKSGSVLRYALKEDEKDIWSVWHFTPGERYKVYDYDKLDEIFNYPLYDLDVDLGEDRLVVISEWLGVISIKTLNTYYKGKFKVELDEDKSKR